MRMMAIRAATCAVLGGVLASTAAADGPLSLQDRIAAVLRSAAPGTRFGLVVLDEDGREIVAIAPDDRFVPASNTKIFTTAAAFALLGDVDAPDRDAGAAVRIEGEDVVLEGHGDARLSSAADCVHDCLATLADAVAARRHRVRDVIGDDSLFPDERWSPGMSWNNVGTRSGTAVSALTLDDNEWRIAITPNAAGRGAATIAAMPYLTIENRVDTGIRTAIRHDRMPGGRTLRLTGTIAARGPAETLRLGIDDPADYAAWRLGTLLAARGVRVTGNVRVRHRAAGANDDPTLRGGARVARTAPPPALARAVPRPLIEDLILTSKTSQNLHAELLLRRIGHVTGSGSIADGQARVTAMLTRAGVERWRYAFADGSGMSSYNRVSPRGVARFLRWTQTQAWGAAWRATLPVGGVDGTLRRRFAGNALTGKIFAKTGTLNAAAALSGFMVTSSGRTFVFASYANDMPDNGDASPLFDAALLLVAGER